MIVFIFILAFIISMLTSIYLKKVLNRLSIVDIPNSRSSHNYPTPRGGGLAIVLSFGVSMYLLERVIESTNLMLPRLFLVGLLVVITGLLDDVFSLGKPTRIVIHSITALLGIYILGGLPNLDFLFYNSDVFIFTIVVVYLIWLLNLYNFMDGINGIATIEAICVLFSGALLSYLVLDNSDWFYILLLAFSCLGFLPLNFPVANLFMGDTGSCFLGIMLGFISLEQGIQNINLFFSWLILLGVFIVDASFTLIRRIYFKEKFFSAHKSHAYQYASRLLDSHTSTTVIVALINIFYLFPIAYIVANGLVSGVVGLCIAYLPLLVIAYALKAGNERRQISY